MKNFFSSSIEKVKSFLTNSTPTTKLKYIVISVITVMIAVSLLVVVSLNTSEPETPTNHENFGTGETASINYDNEIILDIDGESSSIGTTDVITENSSVTTDEVSGTEKPTSAEESTNVQTENNTEPIDNPEPQPTDPSQDYNPDPQPEDTTNTPVVNPKPTETTTRAPQTELKPTETTKVPQPQPKPTETTTNAPQTTAKPIETTKPQETEPQPSGQFSLKEKKYDYNGVNVTILQVENKSQQAYTIMITGKFKDANGNIVKTESKTFEGFPAGWSNYFVFQPGVKYSNVTWGMETVEFSGETMAQYIYLGDKISWGLSQLPGDKNGNFFMPSSPSEANEVKQYTFLGFTLHNMKNSYKSPINFSGDLVVFDRDENLLHIGVLGSNNISAGIVFSRGLANPIPTGILWENRDQYSVPENYSSISGFLALNSITKY